MPEIVRRHWRSIIASGLLLFLAAVLALTLLTRDASAQAADAAGTARYVTDKDLQDWGLRQIGLVVLAVWVPLTIFLVVSSWKVSQWRSKTDRAISDNRDAVLKASEDGIKRHERLRGETLEAIKAARDENHRTAKVADAIAQALITSSMIDDQARRDLTRRVLDRDRSG